MTYRLKLAFEAIINATENKYYFENPNKVFKVAGFDIRTKIRNSREFISEIYYKNQQLYSSADIDDYKLLLEGLDQGCDDSILNYVGYVMYDGFRTKNDFYNGLTLIMYKLTNLEIIIKRLDRRMALINELIKSECIAKEIEEKKSRNAKRRKGCL